MAYNLAAMHTAILSRLREHPRARLSDLSRELGVGLRMIEKAVQAAAGMSFHNLRQGLLVSGARQLLSEPNRSIKEASYLLGFSSPKSFARFVRRACGCTPMQLRDSPRIEHRA